MIHCTKRIEINEAEGKIVLKQADVWCLASEQEVLPQTLEHFS